MNRVGRAESCQSPSPGAAGPCSSRRRFVLCRVGGGFRDAVGVSEAVSSVARRGRPVLVPSPVRPASCGARWTALGAPKAARAVVPGAVAPSSSRRRFVLCRVGGGFRDAVGALEAVSSVARRGRPALVMPPVRPVPREARWTAAGAPKAASPSRPAQPARARHAAGASRAASGGGFSKAAGVSKAARRVARRRARRMGGPRVKASVAVRAARGRSQPRDVVRQ
jgi:hypothetical protein